MKNQLLNYYIKIAKLFISVDKDKYIELVFCKPGEEPAESKSGQSHINCNAVPTGGYPTVSDDGNRQAIKITVVIQIKVTNRWTNRLVFPKFSWDWLGENL